MVNWTRLTRANNGRIYICIYTFSRTRKQGIILLLADEPLMIPFEVGVSALVAEERQRRRRREGGSCV